MEEESEGGDKEYIMEQGLEKKNRMKKLRHIRQYEQKDYLKETTSMEASDVSRVRLEMCYIGNNPGRARICICGHSEGVRAHYIIP